MPNYCWPLAFAGLWLCCGASDAPASSNKVLHAGVRYAIDVPKTDNGLPQNSVLSITQTRDGYLWLGTLDGLVRFDGIRYTVFDEDNTPGLNNSQITNLFEDTEGNLWISTTAGTMVMKDGRIRNAPESEQLHNHRVQITDQLYRARAYPWFRTNRTFAMSTCEDSRGNLVFGTQGAGLVWFDSDGNPTCLSTNDGLSHNIVLSVHVDREGTLWVGTDGGGLNRVRRQVFETLEESLGLVAQSVCEDERGGLWIGFNEIRFDANGAAYWADRTLKRFGPSQGLLNPSVRSVFVDRSQRLWAGTWRGLFQFERGRFQRAANTDAMVVQAIHQDRSGGLWLGTLTGLVRWNEQEWTPFTTRDGLSANDVWAIVDDAEGNLWIGTRGGGLNRFRDGKFTAFRKEDGLPSDNISSLYVDSDGVLWIATRSGLARLHAGKWSVYTTRDGLISNSLRYLIEDAQGYLWIGSNAGLMRVPKKALNDFARGAAAFIPCRTYGTQDGLPTSECTLGSQPGACRARDGKLWFPTIKGLVSVDPAKLNPNTNPPPVMIESVLIEGESQNTNRLRTTWPEAIVIPAGKERLEIHYTSLNLAAPEQARFKYRMEGHETDWTDAGNIRVVRYSKLPAGNFRFQVLASNEDGIWSETGSSLAFIVQPPFWQTWWFLSGAAVALLGTVVSVVHYLSTQKLQRQLASLKQQEALEKERARIARDIHDQLGANLTQVALLGELVESDKDTPEEVEVHARQICHTARETTRTLDEIVWTVNPSNDTLEGLITYICKHAQDYLAVAGVRYRLDVPAQLPEIAVLPEVRHNVFLASKEAVTNVVRHAKASSVCVRLRLVSSSFTLEVEDNGRGVAGMDEKAVQSRNGLRNMRKRMADIGGDFSIGPGTDGGTLVRLTAPLGNHSARHGN